MKASWTLEFHYNLTLINIHNQQWYKNMCVSFHLQCKYFIKIGSIIIQIDTYISLKKIQVILAKIIFKEDTIYWLNINKNQVKLSLLFVIAKRSITFSISGTIAWWRCRSAIPLNLFNIIVLRV